MTSVHSPISSICLLSLILLSVFYPLFSSALDVSYDGRAITINGQRRIILSGSIHYPRSTPEMWPDLMRKAKQGGLNTIDTYVFWNAHEAVQGKYDFLGNNDLIRFLRVAMDQGLYVILRIGPYVCAEWNYGGFPVWLHNLPGIELRTDNPVYKKEMQRFTGDIVNMVKHEKLFASQGGPIILAQIENEYGNIEWAYGNAGKNYIKWCANMAESMKVDVPWIMCQQGDAPDGVINTCNGYYCDQWKPHNNVPKMWTENWAGWYKNWGGQDPHRTAEDVAFAVGRFFQYGGTMQNYYMYHGGTNFGRTAGGPYITTSYDYDAPLDEYGNLRQPKYGHLRRLHQVLLAHEDTIVYGDLNTTDYNNLQSVTKFAYKDKSFCIIGNAKTDEDFMVTVEGKDFTVPAWSATFLRDCQIDIFNTAKVNTQTSVMVMKPDQEDDQPYNLRWKWRGEPFVEDTKTRIGDFTVNQLIDQKAITNSSTDYLWYMTSVQMDNKTCPNFVGKDATLKVHTNGHTLHVFINGGYTGAQYATNGHFAFDYTTQVRLKNGINTISLLSGTVGLPNYGEHFDTTTVGVVGPVTLTLTDGPTTLVQDLSSNPWTYRIGLDGEHHKFFNDITVEQNKWHFVGLPINQKLHWYKANFIAPRGRDPVVVDLKGLGKGEAWINGQSIGRYWPSYIAPTGGCDPLCDYRGSYGSSKCQTNCGNPTQRWYHVPRSYLRDGDNTIVLFEEAGGDPTFVNFKTVSVGKACLNAYQSEKVDLFCQNHGIITSIQFVSYGNPTGTCGSFAKGNCESNNARVFIEKECLRKKYCRFEISDQLLGPTNCQGGQQRLAVEAICS